MTVLVAGAHGVGKTFLAKPAAERLGYRYATASQLIREERGRATWTDTKQVTQIGENQAALVRAVTRIVDRGQRLVLDGHLVLRVGPNEHQRLDSSVFRDLQCQRIIILAAPAAVILNRLMGRGDKTWTASEVDAFCEAEIRHGELVASELGINCAILVSPTETEFESALMLGR